MIVNGVSKLPLQWVEAYAAYMGDYKFKTGDKIEILANYQGEQVSGYTEIPAPIEFTIDTLVRYTKRESINYYPNPGEDIWNWDETGKRAIGYLAYGKVDFKINFKDDPDVENYYLLNIVTKRDRYDFDKEMTGTDGGVYDFEYNDIVFDNKNTESLLPKNSFLPIFSDALINGKDYSLLLTQPKIEKTFLFQGEEIKKGYAMKPRPSWAVERYIISLSSISKDYYLYLKTVEAHRNMIPVFSEPVMIHSNIKNGVGIVGSLKGITKNSSYSSF